MKKVHIYVSIKNVACNFVGSCFPPPKTHCWLSMNLKLRASASWLPYYGIGTYIPYSTDSFVEHLPVCVQPRYIFTRLFDLKYLMPFCSQENKDIFRDLQNTKSLTWDWVCRGLQWKAPCQFLGKRGHSHLTNIGIHHMLQNAGQWVTLFGGQVWKWCVLQLSFLFRKIS